MSIFLGAVQIAHAYGKPVLNPDLTEDIYMLKKDIPLVEELARIMIEKELFLNNK